MDFIIDPMISDYLTSFMINRIIKPSFIHLPPIILAGIAAMTFCHKKVVTPTVEEQVQGRQVALFFMKNSGPLPLSILESPEQIEQVLTEQYRLLDHVKGDINGDDLEDIIVVLGRKRESDDPDDISRYGFPEEESEERPLVLIVNEKEHLRVAAFNLEAVYCGDCGGVLGDPYQGIVHKGNYFSIEHYGGSAWRWSRIITFKYSPEKKDWFLHKDGGETYHVSDPDNTESHVKTTKDFGEVRFSDYKSESAIK